MKYACSFSVLFKVSQPSSLKIFPKHSLVHVMLSCCNYMRLCYCPSSAYRTTTVHTLCLQLHTICCQLHNSAQIVYKCILKFPALTSTPSCLTFIKVQETGELFPYHHHHYYSACTMSVLSSACYQ